MRRRHIFALIPTVLAALSVASCGFKLRGSQSGGYAFESIFSGFALGSSLGQDFKRAAEGQGLRVLSDAINASTAQVVLRVHSEQREKMIVGSGASGQVREFQLRIRVKFSLFTAQGKTLLEEIEMLQQREFSYTESQALAKEAEEQLLYRDMQSEIVLQLMRRLSSVKAL